MANHLNGRLGTACKVIESYQKQDDQDPKYEVSEMHLYKNMILEEMGDYEQALKHLEKSSGKIVDKLAAKEKRAYFLVKLDRLEEARTEYESLMERNVENLAYHSGLQATYGLVEDGAPLEEAKEVELLELYNGMQKKFPRANACRRIPLDFCTGERFVTVADLYIRKKLRSGIPSLYSDLLPLYKNAAKVELLQKLEESMLVSLEATGKFPVSEAEPEPKEESPMVIMWLWMLLANHYERNGMPKQALILIDKAIEHTPSCVELYLCKARIYKHHGNTKAAAICMEKARSMDLADRYLNTRASVYFLKDGDIKKATDTVILFAREGDHSNLHEMQAMWWAIECGNAYLRAKDYPMALKKLTAVEKYFTDFSEDQFDFHSYCLRKMTLRTYVDMLRNAEKIRSNKNFTKIAKSIIECYLHLHTNPQIADETVGMSEKELKKAKAKKAKADARAKEEAMKAAKGKKGGGKKKEESKDGEEKKKEKPKKQDNKEQDDDPDGQKLLKLEPLEQCLKYVNLLQKFQPELVLTHTLAYDVYKAMGVPLAQLKSLRKAAGIDATSPELQVRMCDFFHGVESGSLKLSDVAKEIVDELKSDADLLGGKSINDYNAAYAAAATTAPQRVAAVKGAQLIGTASVADTVKVLSDLSGEGVTRVHAEECHRLLEGLDTGAAAKFKEVCAAKFPLSCYFDAKNLETSILFAPETMWRDKEIEG